MSSRGRGQGYPCFVEGQSSTLSWSSFQPSPFPDYRDTLFQNPNSILTNQTLEDAFARLSVYPNNHSFVGERSGLTGAAKRFHFEGYGRGSGSSNYRSNIGQMQRVGRYNGNDAVAARVPPGGSYDAFMSQKERQRVYPRLPVSNDEFCFGFHGKSRGGVMSNELPSANGRGYGLLLQQPLTQCCVYDLKGKILALAKDQVGCRILQERMKSLSSQEQVSFVFLELIGSVIELMLDPSGNYVFQKLVEICSEEQRTSIILMATKTNFQFVNICLDVHGTRAVQKLLEHVTSQEQRNLLMPAICHGTVALTKDANGLHVIEHCLKHFSNEDNEYLLNIVANNCFDIATDKSGCCVMQHCVDHAQGETKEHLMNEIILNSSLLAEDCYGNYVVQHLVSLRIPRVIESLLRQLENNFFSLACNKYGSNVVEKFFHDSGEEHSTQIILELLINQKVSMLLVDPYGNYVIKTALAVSMGPIRSTLCEMVERHSPMMRNNLYGKKLLAWFDRWKLRRM